MKKICLSALVFLMFSAFAVSTNAGTIFRNVISENAPGTNGSWAFGTIFTVGANNVNVTSLGAYDFLGDGFTTVGGIKVGIFDESSTLLLGSTTVLSSDVLLGSYRYSSVNLNLIAGQQYRLVAVSGSDRYIQGNSAWTYSSDFNNISYGYGSSTTLQRLNGNLEGDYGMGNFQYGPATVPEPTSIAIFGFVGLLAASVCRRKKL